MRTHQRLAWLGSVDGVLVAVLMRRLTSDEGPHQLVDLATVLTLLLGFLGTAAAALRSLRANRISEGGSPPWFTMLAYSVLMIVMTWRWAFLFAPYNVQGAVTLSVLMLGFLRSCAITTHSLAASSETHGAAPANESQDALLLFPAEDAGATDQWRRSRMLATGRKALL